MINLNEEHRLGRKAYLLIASRKMTPGLIIVLVAAVLLAASGAIGGLIYGGISAMAGPNAHTASMVSGTMVDIVLVLFILGLVVMLVGLIIARIQYANYTYTFEEFDLRMRHGIFHRVVNSTPYRQIQDVDIDRSLAQQLLGLSKVTIITAGHEEAAEHEKVEVVLEPLDKDAAEEVRLMLERKIGVQVVKTELQADVDASPSPAPSVTTTSPLPPGADDRAADQP